MDKYGNMAVFEHEKTGRIFMCDPAVSSYTLEDQTELQINFRKEDHALHPYYAELSMYDKDVEHSVYAVPPRINVAIDNPCGFGVIPSPTWETESKRGAWPEHIRQSIRNWLAQRVAIDYQAAAVDLTKQV